MRNQQYQKCRAVQVRPEVPIRRILRLERYCSGPIVLCCPSLLCDVVIS